jgi:hypothetical protein
LILSNFKDESEAKKQFEKPLIEWDYVKKLKAVLYYFHFNQKISFYGNYKEFLSEVNEIYQYRNKNHRGGIQSDYQKEITDKVDENKYRYYFRFMHYLEKFVSKL